MSYVISVYICVTICANPMTWQSSHPSTAPFFAWEQKHTAQGSMVQTNMAVPKDSALPGSLVLGLYPTAMERYPTTGPPKMLPQVSATVLLRDRLQMSLNVSKRHSSFGIPHTIQYQSHRRRTLRTSR